MSTTISSYLPSLLSSAWNNYTATYGTPTRPQDTTSGTNTSSSDTASSTITLSEAAQAYLDSIGDTTGNTADDTGKPLATLLNDARTWFDEQYTSLGIGSAMVDGQVAVDLTGQSRASLSAVAADSTGLFSEDEKSAAGIALQLRFDDSMSPHVVIARHTGDYASLYQAAADYLDQAGADEQATPLWQEQRAAVATGLAMAQADPSKAPDTGSSNDPVAALLAKTTASGTAAATDTSTESVAANARALLDDQINSAKDNGTTLVYSASDPSGQLVDFSGFDNQSLATIVLNSGNDFSGSEITAARTELNQRNRTTMLSALNSASDPASNSLGLLGTLTKMSPEEQKVMGVTSSVINRLVQSYSTMTTLQNAFNNTSNAVNNSLSLANYL